MKEVKYRYAFDETGKLVCIDEITKESKKGHSYACIYCGEPLSPRFYQDRAVHFAHQPDTVCDGESYLHKLSKMIIKEKFLSGQSFFVNVPADSICSEKDSCPFFNQEWCKQKSSMSINLRNHYDRCEDEMTVYCRLDEKGKKRAYIYGNEGDEKYVADLLLWKEDCPNREPVAIEIYHSHACDPEKIASGLKNIEIAVKRNEDIEELKKEAFGKADISFHSFQAIAPESMCDLVNIYSRFCFFKSGAANLSTIEDYQYCSKRHVRSNKYSLVELNIGIANSCGLDSDPVYRDGLVYLLKHGYQFCNCILCKNYIGYDKSYTGEPFCTANKMSGIRNPVQKDANSCDYYQLDNRKIALAEKDLKTLPIEMV